MITAYIGSYYNIYEIILIFFTYAFLGWIAEVAYATFKTGKFINRGFLNGPVCPIYGVGVTVVLLVITPFKENVLLLFAVSVLLTSALEFLTGFILEKLFHKRWWDYSDRPFNLMGYICLIMSVLWGIACITVVYAVNPPIVSLIRLIEKNIPVLGYIFMGIFAFIFAVDFIITLMQISKLGKRLKQLDKISGAMRYVSDSFGVKISDIAATVAADAKNIKEDINSLQTKLKKSRLMKAFPELLKIKNKEGQPLFKEDKQHHGDFINDKEIKR